MTGVLRWSEDCVGQRYTRLVIIQHLGKEARRLRSEGLTYKQVSQVLGRKLGTVVGVLNGNHWIGI